MLNTVQGVVMDIYSVTDADFFLQVMTPIQMYCIPASK